MFIVFIVMEINTTAADTDAASVHGAVVKATDYHLNTLGSIPIEM